VGFGKRKTLQEDSPFSEKKKKKAKSRSQEQVGREKGSVEMDNGIKNWGWVEGQTFAFGGGLGGKQKK